MPQTTKLEDLIELQIDNGNEQLETHKRTCPSNATYVSKATTSELLSTISHCIEEDLMRLKASQFISIMADESADVSSKEKLSVCGRWLESGKPVEHFLGIIHAQEVNAESLTRYLSYSWQQFMLLMSTVKFKGILLTIWKTFRYSPQKTEKLVEIQAVLDAPEIKIHKPSDT